MRKLIFIFTFGLGPLVACGGADSVELFGPGGNPPGQDAAAVDGSADTSPTFDSGPGACDLSKCAIIVPQDFRLVTASNNRAVACPAGWKSTDVVSDPVAGSACSCACNVTGQPDCTGGDVQRLRDGLNQCGQAATTLTVTGNGACDPFNNFTIALQSQHYETIAPKAKGGACQFDAKPDPTKVKTVDGRLCEPPTSCQGEICKMAQVCVAHAGDVDCPADYPNKRLVGSDVTVECSSCSGGCNLKSECTGTLSLYNDQNCTQGKTDFTADSTCKPAPISTGNYASASYQGSVKSATCDGVVPTSTGTPKLGQETTVCCNKKG